MRILLCAIAMAATAFAAPRGAQPGAISLTGTVLVGAGPEARPVRRARVTLVARGGAAPRVGDTDPTGKYRFDGLTPGDYKVSVQKPGFVKLEADASHNATLT